MSDFFSFLPGIAGIGQMATGLYDSVYNTIASERQFNYQKELNELAQKNYEEQFAFQKQAYEENKLREDNAIQRRVADAQSAGINPVAVLGGAGAGSANTVSQPHFSGGELKTMRSEIFQGLQMAQQMEFQKRTQEAQIENINAQTRKTNAEAKFLEESEDTRLSQLAENLKITQAQAKKLDAETQNILTENKKINGEIERLKLINDKQKFENYCNSIMQEVIDSYPVEYRQVLYAKNIGAEELKYEMLQKNHDELDRLYELRDQKNSREWVQMFGNFILSGLSIVSRM